MSEGTKKCKYCQIDIPQKAKICPNCKKKQKSKLGIVLIVFGLFIVICAIGSGSKTETTTTTTQTKTQSETKETVKEEPKEEVVEELIEYTVCTVDEMMETLNSNAMKAEKEYSDKYLEVTGRLGNIDSDGKYISIYEVNNEWAIIGVQCYIKNDSQKDQVIEMSKDDVITLRVKCKSVGEVLGYSADIIEILD